LSAGTHFISLIHSSSSSSSSSIPQHTLSHSCSPDTMTHTLQSQSLHMRLHGKAVMPATCVHNCT
jgi:hypothetical protein